MKIKYIVYYLEERDFRKRRLLQEIKGKSRFDTREEAVAKAISLISLVNKRIQTTVLEVYCI